MKTFRGIIALDIDGTITVETHTLDLSTLNFLNGLIADNWCVVFISGRTFSFARPVLSKLMGKYYFSVQNGAALYEMPQVKQLTSHYLSGNAIIDIKKHFCNEPVGLLIETGQERDDVCYYCPDDFSLEEREYIDFRISISEGLWIPVKNFDLLDISTFACGKFFSTKEKAEEMKKKIPYPVTLIQDPFRKGHYLAHINSKEASKGEMLKEVRQLFPGIPVIAAGDDLNDIAMLKVADIKIVMGSAPDEMRYLADILAPAATDQGIIPALQEAINERIPQLN